MLKRTTNYMFQPFGDVFYTMPQYDKETVTCQKTFNDREFNIVHKSKKPVYLSTMGGIILLAVSKDGMNFEEFVIHRVVRLKPDIYFNVVSISNQSTVDIRYTKSETEHIQLENKYEYFPIVPKIKVNEILSSFYQVRKGNYIFPGEIHEYYELVYIDHGELDTTVENKEYHLEKYDLMLYYPGQFHAQSTEKEKTCSYLTITFDMDCTLDHDLKNKVFHTNKDIYQVLSKYMKAMQSKGFLSKEYAMLHLKEAIILLYQSERNEETEISNTMQEHYESTLLNEILVFIHNNVYTAFTVEDICQKFSVSRSTLQTLFNTNIKTTPKQYISNLKLKQAKLLIQEHKYTISEISDILGFTSIHYFSRKFKLQFGISPTDYAKSINQ